MPLQKQKRQKFAGFAHSYHFSGVNVPLLRMKGKWKGPVAQPVRALC